MVRRGGTFNTLAAECQTMVRRRGGKFNILAAAECQTQWYEEVVSSIFHHCQFQEIVSHVTLIYEFIHLTAVADEMT